MFSEYHRLLGLSSCFLFWRNKKNKQTNKQGRLHYLVAGNVIVWKILKDSNLPERLVLFSKAVAVHNLPATTSLFPTLSLFPHHCYLTPLLTTNLGIHRPRIPIEHCSSDDKMHIACHMIALYKGSRYPFTSLQSKKCSRACSE